MSLYALLDWIYYLFFSAILFPVVIAFSQWPSVPKSVRWVAWLLVALLVIEISSTSFRYNQVRNHFLYYFRTLAILWFGAAFYAPRLSKNVCYSAALIISLFMLIEIVFWVGVNHINSVTLSVSGALLALCAFITLRQLLIEEPTKPLWDQADFFLHSGLLVFGFFSFITSAFKNQFIESSLNLYYFLDTLAVMTNAVAFVILARGFWLIGSARPGTLSR